MQLSIILLAFMNVLTVLADSTQQSGSSLLEKRRIFGKGKLIKKIRQQARCREDEQEMKDKTAALEAWSIAARESDSPYTYETTSVQGFGEAIVEIQARMLSEECKFLGYTDADFYPSLPVVPVQTATQN
jgi:hypothetical protein